MNRKTPKFSHYGINDVERAYREKAVRMYYPDYSDNEIEAMTGIPHVTVWRLAKQLGIKHTPEALARLKCNRTINGITPMERRLREEVIRLLYATKSCSEISEQLGLSPHYISNVVQRLKLTHSPEVTLRLIEKRIKSTKTREAIQRKIKRDKQVYVLELNRKLQGLPARTKWRVSTVTSATQRCMAYLCFYFGYFKDPDSDDTLFYNEHTRRRLPGTPLIRHGTESFYSGKFGIKFRPLRRLPRRAALP